MSAFASSLLPASVSPSRSSSPSIHERSNHPISLLLSPISPKPRRAFSLTGRTSQHLPYPPQSNDDENPEPLVQDLRVPDQWLVPSKASEESEWLRVNLHKWLDEEYCPEATNVEISKVAAFSFYKSLLEKQTDLGEILLKMVRELESISYQESFHSPFSSANAAVNLIVQRIDHV